MEADERPQKFVVRLLMGPILGSLYDKRHPRRFGAEEASSWSNPTRSASPRLWEIFEGCEFFAQYVNKSPKARLRVSAESL
jgi:hypothetical protein